MTPKTQTVKFKRGTNIGQLTEKFKCCRLPLKRKCEKCQRKDALSYVLVNMHLKILDECFQIVER